jgi:hypothetical protein
MRRGAAIRSSVSDMIFPTTPLSRRMHLSASNANRLVFVLYMTLPLGASSYSMSMGAMPFRWNSVQTSMWLGAWVK